METTILPPDRWSKARHTPRLLLADFVGSRLAINSSGIHTGTIAVPVEIDKRGWPKKRHGGSSRKYTIGMNEANMICRFPGCDHDVFTAGLCHGHYAQKRRGAELAPLRKRDGLVPITIRVRPETIETLKHISALGQPVSVTARAILEAATGGQNEQSDRSVPVS